MATTGYELVKESIFEKADEVCKGLDEAPSDKKLLGAWEALINVMDAAALLDEYNELRKTRKNNFRSEKIL